LNLVLDASVALSWCFEDEEDDYALSVLRALRESEAIVPSLWPLELVNGLTTAERKRRIGAAEAARFLNAVKALPVVVEPLSREAAFGAVRLLAHKHRLSAYDAAYLDLAVRLGVPLATLDKPLRNAAAAEGLPSL
jgi:predicted nucleic acid-binding protein